MDTQRKYNVDNLKKGQNSMRIIVTRARELYNSHQNNITWKQAIAAASKERRTAPIDIITEPKPDENFEEKI